MAKISRRQFVRSSMHTAVRIGAGAALLPTLGGSALGGQANKPARPRLRVAQIGTTHAHAEGKMMALRALPDLYEVVAVAETNFDRRRQLSGSKTFGDLKWLEVEDLLELPGLDVVLIETGIDEAPEMARRALAAGVHIHLDKPGARDHAEFAAIRNLAEERGLIVQMGYMLRHLPIMEFMFKIVREGWLGAVLEIESSMSRTGQDSWFQQLAKLPGGGMFDLGCHMIDLIITVLGNPKTIRAVSTPSERGIKAGAEDNQVAIFEYPAANATVRVNCNDPFGVPRRRFIVVGTEGTIEVAQLESGSARLMLEYDRPGYAAGSHDLEMPYQYGRYGGEFIALASAIKGGQALPWDADHDIAVHAATLRASGRTVIPVAGG